MKTRGSISPAARAAGYVGLVLHALLVVPLWTVVLVAPEWAVVLLLVIWAALLVFAVLLLRRRPSLVPLVPVAMVVIAFGLVTFGGAFLGWTA